MKAIRKKTPPAYRVFRLRPGGVVTVLQIRDPETGEYVLPHELEAYRVLIKLDVVWQEIAVTAGSRLLLTPKAARFMLAAGTIETLEEPLLIGARPPSGRRHKTISPEGPGSSYGN